MAFTEGPACSQNLPVNVEIAEKNYTLAVTLAKKLEMRPLEAHCYLSLGKLYQRVNKLKKGKNYLVKAGLMYRGLSMDYWQYKAEASLNELEK